MVLTKNILKQQPIDNVLIIIDRAAIILQISLVVYFYNALPKSVPSHFNFLGEPNDYQDRWIIFVLPLVSFIMSITLTRLIKSPEKLSYPIEITESNANVIFKIASQSLGILRLIFSWFFFLLTYQTIQIALGKAKGLGTYTIPIFVSFVLCIILIAVFRIIRNK